jgi:adhesin transport system outer membrane protein
MTVDTEAFFSMLKGLGKAVGVVLFFLVGCRAMKVTSLAIGLSLLAASVATVGDPSVAASLQDEAGYLLDSHPRLRAARNNVLATDEGIKRSYAEYLPTINAVTNWGYEHTNSPGLRTSRNGRSMNTPTESLSFTLTENLFNGFRREANNETARINRDVAAISLETVQQEILFEAAAAYLNVLRHAKLIEFAAHNEQTIQRQLNLEDERVLRGAGISVDVLQSKSRLQIAKERRVAFEGNLRNAVARYVQVYDRQPEVGSKAIPRLPVELIPATLNQAEAVALAENPVLANSQHAVSLSTERKKIAESPFYPEVDFIAEYNYEQDAAGVVGSRRDYIFKVEARWELYSGFSTRADTADAAYQRLAAMDNHNFVNRKVVEDVRLSWDQLETVRSRVALLENAINIAVEVHESRIKRREAGQETLLDVLDAENEVFNAQIGATDAAFDARIAVYRLLFSMGRMTPGAMMQTAGGEAEQSVAEWATTD